MKKILAIAALASVSGCSKPAPLPEADSKVASQVSTSSRPEVMSADGKSPVGTFKATGPDGKVIGETVHADGTFTSIVDGKAVGTGRWAQIAPSTYCALKDKPGARGECTDEKIENGVWTARDAKGVVYTIERVEE